MTQTQENGEKPHFEGPKLNRHFFFSKIWLHQSLNIMVNYHNVQYQEKLIIQS